MSKQLQTSAIFSVLAMLAMVVAMHGGSPERGGREATAHGSIISVLLGA